MFKNLRIPVEKSNQEIIICQSIFSDISKYMQEGNKPENGGLLFAEFYLPKIFVRKASMPNKTDYRNRHEFKPDQVMQQKTINVYFKKGLHYIGEWHTHPEEYPVPSVADITSMQDTFIASRHELNYFLLIIAGNKISNDMFWIGLQNASKTIDLLKNKSIFIVK
jgi:integrative and conjugative element protein (TIGR02256 family)